MIEIYFTLENVIDYVEAGYDINAKGRWRYPNFYVIDPQAADNRDTLLVYACKCAFNRGSGKQVHIVEYLLNNGATDNDMDALQYTIFYDYLDIAKCLVDKNNNYNYLIQALSFLHEVTHSKTDRSVHSSFLSHVVGKLYLINNLSRRECARVSKLLRLYLIDDLSDIIMDYVTN